jgi:Myb/SANT-like DNA-binding domain
MIQENVWKKVCAEFNAKCSGTAPRTVEQLKSKFTNMKRDVRKGIAEERSKLLKTGGGPFKPSKEVPFMERVLALISFSAAGMSNGFGCDTIPGRDTGMSDDGNDEDPAEDISENETEVDEFMLDVSEMNEIENESFTVMAACKESDISLDQTWATYSPNMLRQPKHPLLSIVNSKKATTSKDAEPVASTSANGKQQTESANANGKANKKRSTPPSKPATTTIDRTGKFGLLAESKREWAVLRTSVLREEAEWKKLADKEEHCKKMILLDLQIESQRIAVQIQKAELELKLKQLESHK